MSGLWEKRLCQPLSGFTAEVSKLSWSASTWPTDSAASMQSGYMVGHLDMDDAHLRSISLELQLAIVNVDYRRAPEHPFPTAFNDGYAALQWVRDTVAIDVIAPSS